MPSSSPQENSIVENAVSQGGAYEVIRARLSDQGKSLSDHAQHLNQARKDEFGSTEMSVLHRLRLRTEHNCVARDLVRIGDYVLFGYNVFIGLKNTTQIADVFALYTLEEKDGVLDAHDVPHQGTFLADQRFVNDFDELYNYYKQTKLVQLVVKHGKLLAAFQIGDRLDDIRVFRWNISSDGKQLEYIDNRGERDIALPPAYDFEWIKADREDVIEGRNPHINVLNTLFIDTLRGDLTVKVEDNTDTGLGIYNEPVEQGSQSLDDAQFFYASVGQLILLKIQPYQEEQFRYLVFNKIQQNVTRIDAIGEACVQLPEDHGIIFPGGYYLTTGEFKQFDDTAKNLKFKRVIKSPNGEDVIFVFYQPEEGLTALFGYNLIEKTLQNPIYGHGYGFFEDGQLAVFHSDDEATRIHPIQIWQTPFYSDEFASEQPVSTSFLGKIGNSELVRGISELYSLTRLIKDDNAQSAHFNELSKQCSKIFDAYFWLESWPEVSSLAELAPLIRTIGETSELVLDEFDKVQSIQKQANEALKHANAEQKELERRIKPDGWRSPQNYVDALAAIRSQRGHLLTIKDYRYMDVAAIDALEADCIEWEEELNQLTVDFLCQEDALDSYSKDLKVLEQDSDAAQTAVEIAPVIEKFAAISQGLDILSELMATLKISDATQQTKIIEAISELYSQLNQQKARTEQRQKSFGAEEATAQFGAQFKLLSQSINNALGLANTPDKAEEQLTRLMVQLEELEAQFSDYDQFLNEIIIKRDEIFETFEAHKQSLLEARQRKAQTLNDSAARLLESIGRRTSKFKEADELNSFFAADSLVQKIRDISEQLNELDDNVKADDLMAKLKAQQEQAVRALRDKSDIYEDGGNVIKLGPRHKFSVNTQELDLSILPKNDGQYIHLSGTDFYQRIDNEELTALKPYWPMSIVSENDEVYRGEYLAFSFMMDTLSQPELSAEDLSEAVKAFATPRYQEGYDKGIHDYDATQILKQLIPSFKNAGTLKYNPLSRAFALLFWLHLHNQDQSSDVSKLWLKQAVNAQQLNTLFNDDSAYQSLVVQVTLALTQFRDDQSFDQSQFTETGLTQAAHYLIEEMAQSNGSTSPVFSSSSYANKLNDSFKLQLKAQDSWNTFEALLKDLNVADQWQLCEQWLKAFLNHGETEDNEADASFNSYISEVIVLIIDQLSRNKLKRDVKAVELSFTVNDLLGNHKQLVNGELSIQLDEFLYRLNQHQNQSIKGFKALVQLRQDLADAYKKELRLNEFKARPLASFVRNKLINEAYLPVIGDNLAKQMGTVGAKKRTDLMGLLMMISPPGYGKTTLMEYVANRLGLVFMKINCPSIGHEVTGLDPDLAPDSASREELKKINLSFEMGSNTMLYLDDIQHTNPEFLQKFISLCDGTRRIDGMWNGQSKTYDMRGKKFCVVMAGNPYTETGEVFRIPDMLANRADIYNLGDILGGQEDVFALSYIENSLTSNPVLAPLATRDMSDVYKFVEMSKGANIASTDLSHAYSGAEIKEITDVLQKMTRAQEVILKVNQQYIKSAATSEAFREEPGFKLQGSYRNMNKMAEKINSVMSDVELNQMIADHYQGESQLLSNGSEENLLKLAELRGDMSDEQQTRWNKIKADFIRNKALGGEESDSGERIAMQLVDLVSQIGGIKEALLERAERAEQGQTAPSAAPTSSNENDSNINTGLEKLVTALNELPTPNVEVTVEAAPVNDNSAQLSAALNTSLEKITQALAQLPSNLPTPKVEVVNQPVPGIDKLLTTLADTFENSFLPLVKVMDGKINVDLGTHDKMHEISRDLKAVLGKDGSSDLDDDPRFEEL